MPPSDRSKALYNARREELSAIFAKRLRVWFDNTDITKADFARKCKMTEEALAGYMNGHRCPTAVMLKEIMKETMISADYWLGVTNDAHAVLPRRAR